jgi:hypothetical protein
MSTEVTTTEVPTTDVSITNVSITNVSTEKVSTQDVILDTKPLIEKCINALIDDEKFVSECKTDIEQILIDKKITSADVPYIIKILLLAFQKSKTIDIDNEDLDLFIKTLLIELLKKLDLEDDLEKILTPEINSMIDTCIELLRIQLITTSGNILQSIIKCFTDCRSNSCCKSKCCK